MQGPFARKRTCPFIWRILVSDVQIPVSLCATQFPGQSPLWLVIEKTHPNRYQKDLQVLSSPHNHRVHGFQSFWTPLTRLYSMCLGNTLLAQGRGSGSQRRDGHRKKTSKGTNSTHFELYIQRKGKPYGPGSGKHRSAGKPFRMSAGGVSFLIQGLTLL